MSTWGWLVLTLLVVDSLAEKPSFSECIPSLKSSRCPSNSICIAKDSLNVMCACYQSAQTFNGPTDQRCEDGFFKRGIDLQSNFQKQTVPTSALDSSSGQLDVQFSRFTQTAMSSNGVAAWCETKSSANPYIEVDLGNTTLVSMVALKTPQLSVLYYIQNYSLQSFQGNKWVDYSADNSKKITVFSTSLQYGLPSYSFINPPIMTRKLRLLPISVNEKACLRWEVFGNGYYNECSPSMSGFSNCDINADCNDLADGFECICHLGYAGDGTICQDINECITNFPCSQDGTCNNTVGSYECTCNLGFTGDGFFCDDVDECAENSTRCGPNTKCVNTPGSYRCECLQGFFAAEYGCNDTDECITIIPPPCGSNAVCQNTVGSFYCNCSLGYELIGLECSNIDECKLGLDTCVPPSYCIDNDGSYVCSCSGGYQMTSSGCRDVNECSIAGLNTCGLTMARCLNTISSYACIYPKEIPYQPSSPRSSEISVLQTIVRDYISMEFEETYNPWDSIGAKLISLYLALNRNYDYIFRTLRQPFPFVYVEKNMLAVEMYGHRCKEIGKFSFPNAYLPEYQNLNWRTTRDVTTYYMNLAIHEPFQERDEVLFPTPMSGVSTIDADQIVAFSRNAKKYVMSPSCKLEAGAYQELSGVIQSPNFPDLYPNSLQCELEISVPAGSHMVLNFTFFEMEYDKTCTLDYLAVYDGTGQDKLLMKRLCGSSLPQVMISTRSSMLLVFVTDKASSFRGFQAYYKMYDTWANTMCVSYNASAITNKLIASVLLKRALSVPPSQMDLISVITGCIRSNVCTNTPPKDSEFLLQHQQRDKKEKICAMWDPYGIAGWIRSPCIVTRTNTTHTHCKCKGFGLVAVWGRGHIEVQARTIISLELATNIYVSLAIAVVTLLFSIIYSMIKDTWLYMIPLLLTHLKIDSGRLIQLHFMFSVFMTELIFLLITFVVPVSQVTCMGMAFVFYYIILTMFSWHLVYALFMFSRVTPLVDSVKVNMYKINVCIGYGLPLFVMTAVSGLEYNTDRLASTCWMMLNGLSVWSFGAPCFCMALMDIVLLLITMSKLKENSNKAHFRDLCLKNLLVLIFAILTTVSAVWAITGSSFGPMFALSICNMLLVFSILFFLCLMKREAPMVLLYQKEHDVFYMEIYDKSEQTFEEKQAALDKTDVDDPVFKGIIGSDAADLMKIDMNKALPHSPSAASDFEEEPMVQMTSSTSKEQDEESDDEEVFYRLD